MWCNNLVSTANYSVCAEIVLLCFHLFGICKNMLFFQVGWIVFDLDTDICSLYLNLMFNIIFSMLHCSFNRGKSGFISLLAIFNLG